MMRFGVCTGLENAGVLASMGFDYVEVHTCNMMSMDEKSFADYCAVNEAAPIRAEVANCLFPGDMMLVGPDADAERIRFYIQRVMKRLAALGVSVLVFGSGGCRRFPEDYPEEHAWRQMVNLGLMLGREAEPHGITVVLEPLCWGETNMVNSVWVAQKLIREVGHPNFRMLCDLYHFYQVGDSLRDLENCGDVLRHVHIAKPDDRCAMYPGDGMNYRDFFASVRKAGYDGRISFEGTLRNMQQELPNVLEVLNGL